MIYIIKKLCQQKEIVSDTEKNGINREKLDLQEPYAYRVFGEITAYNYQDYNDLLRVIVVLDIINI